MRKWFTQSSYHIKIEGNNFVNFFNVLIKNNIEVYNVKRSEVGVLEVVVLQKDLKKITTVINHLGFSITVLNILGFSKLINGAKYRIGYVVGLLLSIILLILANQFIFNYKILGTENISITQVEKCIENFGVKKYTINSFDVKDLEQYLSNNIDDISMVSVIKKGTTLIINIKEKLPDVGSDFQPITAQFNMLITKLDIFAGFSSLQVGDSVMKGDVLVYPYVFNSSGEIVKCTPVADIVGKVWFCESELVVKKEIVFARTGKTIKNSFYTIGDFVFLKTNNKNTFTHFEVVEKTVPVSNIFLPISLHTTTYFEVIEKTINRDIEKEKDNITSKLIAKAKTQVPTNILIENEKVIISNYDDKHIISVYLEATVSF